MLWGEGLLFGKRIACNYSIRNESSSLQEFVNFPVNCRRYHKLLISDLKASYCVAQSLEKKSATLTKAELLLCKRLSKKSF